MGFLGIGGFYESWSFGGSCSLGGSCSFGGSLGMNVVADGFKSGILNDCFIMNSAVFICFVPGVTTVFGCHPMSHLMLVLLPRQLHNFSDRVKVVT